MFANPAKASINEAATHVPNLIKDITSPFFVCLVTNTPGVPGLVQPNRKQTVQPNRQRKQRRTGFSGLLARHGLNAIDFANATNLKCKLWQYKCC